MAVFSTAMAGLAGVGRFRCRGSLFRCHDRHFLPERLALDNEGGVAVFELPPQLARLLIETDVARHVYTPVDRIIEPVSLAAGLIAQHHHWLAPVVKFLQPWPRMLGLSPDEWALLDPGISEGTCCGTSF